MEQSELLGFDKIVEQAEADNRERDLHRRCGHLPRTMREAMPHFRDLLERHHHAMLAADAETVMRLREEAHDLALWLNKGEPGILAHEDAPGCVLTRETAAPPGAVPLWGQSGMFAISASGMRARIEMEGIFGIGCSVNFWPGFAAHAVDLDRPFLSETGYRSFLGIHADLSQGLTPASFAITVVAAYIAKNLKGKLRRIR